MKETTHVFTSDNLHLRSAVHKQKNNFSISKLPEMKKQLAVGNEKTIEEVRREFNNQYPFLKLEFFSVRRKKNELSPNSKIISHDKKIGVLRKKNKEDKISIAPANTVLQVEQEFENILGLHVQVFRKSGNIWIETNLTDGWTLAKQNEEGLELSKPLKKSKEENEFPNLDTE